MVHDPLWVADCYSDNNASGFSRTGRAITFTQYHIIQSYPKQNEFTNIYYDRQTQQCFLLTCYFVNYRMS